MTEPYTVGQYLVDRLTELGLRDLFSIAGDYSIDWLNKYVTPSQIQIREEVNELCAGYAADGYARLRGIGALCVTYSAGSLSAVNPIAGAYVEKVPVVLINGTPNIKRTLTFEQTGFSAHHFISGRQTDLQVFEYITVATARIDNPDLAPMLIDYALTQCITERRPVYIELLQDMVELACERPQGRLKRAICLNDPTSLAGAIADISHMLATASHPLIWLGVEIDRFGLTDKAEQLIRQLNIPFVTELLSKAVLSEDDPLFAGVFDGRASLAPVQDLVKNSDFILALGVWLTDINDLGWAQDFDKTAFVSFDTVKYGTTFWPQVSLQSLIDGLIDKPVTREDRAFQRAPSVVTPESEPGDPIGYQGFYNFIQRYIDHKTIVGCDASLNFFGGILMRVPKRGGFFAQPSYSSIGYIAPAATGVCLAKEADERVMVFSGDGGFQMSAQCLSTQTRFGLNPIVFVIDNGVYGVEQWLADASVFSDPAKSFYKSCILHRWNYSALAGVFGCSGWKVHTYGELEEAIEKALRQDECPSIIQVVIPAKSIPVNAEWKESMDAEPSSSPLTIPSVEMNMDTNIDSLA